MNPDDIVDIYRVYIWVTSGQMQGSTQTGMSTSRSLLQIFVPNSAGIETGTSTVLASLRKRRKRRRNIWMTRFLRLTSALMSPHLSLPLPALSSCFLSGDLCEGSRPNPRACRTPRATSESVMRNVFNSYYDNMPHIIQTFVLCISFCSTVIMITVTVTRCQYT